MNGHWDPVPAFRPYIDEITILRFDYKDYIDLMQSCWEEDENNRPSFNELKNKIKKFTK